MTPFTRWARKLLAPAKPRSAERRTIVGRPTSELPCSMNEPPADGAKQVAVAIAAIRSIRIDAMISIASSSRNVQAFRSPRAERTRAANVWVSFQGRSGPATVSHEIETAGNVTEEAIQLLALRRVRTSLRLKTGAGGERVWFHSFTV